MSNSIIPGAGGGNIGGVYGVNVETLSADKTIVPGVDEMILPMSSIWKEPSKNEASFEDVVESLDSGEEEEWISVI